MPLAGKPISAYRPPARTPAQWSAHAPVARPPLAQFVLLSMLLHLLAISLFGAPSGGSREGRALWGALNVALVDSARSDGPELKLDSRLKVNRKPERAAPRKEPARAQPKLDEAPFSMPPLLDRVLSPDRKFETVPPLKVPPPTEVQAPPVPIAPPPTPAPREPPPPEPVRVERFPAQAPLLSAPLVQPTPMPLTERLLTPPTVEPAPMENLIVPAMPLTPPVQTAPIEAPAIPVPAPETVAPVRIEPTTTRPAERSPERVEPQAPPAPPAPTRIEREVAPITEPALRPAPFRAPPVDTVRPRPDEPSTNYDPTAAPSLDIDAMRKRAAAMTRQGTGNRAALPFPMPPVPERKTKEQIAIGNARKPDCRTAYQSLGLAAIVPLIANEFGEGNCRW